MGTGIASYILAFLFGRFGVAYALGMKKREFLKFYFSYLRPIGLEHGRLFLISLMLVVFPVLIFKAPADLTILSVFAAGTVMAVRKRVLTWTSHHGPASFIRSRDENLQQFGQAWVAATRNIGEGKLFRIMADRLPVLFEAKRMAELGGLDQRTAAFVRRSTIRLQDEEATLTAPKRENERQKIHGILDATLERKDFVDIEEREDRIIELAQRMQARMSFPIPEIGDMLVRMLRALGVEETDRYLEPRRPMLEQLMADAERFGLDERASRDLKAFLKSLTSIVETAEWEAREEAALRQSRLSKNLLNLDKEES